jgi:IS30 family transposase
LVKVPRKDTATVVAVLSRHVNERRRDTGSLRTWNRGLEMAKHKSFTVATNVKVYFCDPQSPWQRGATGHVHIYNWLLSVAEVAAMYWSGVNAF